MQGLACSHTLSCTHILTRARSERNGGAVCNQPAQALPSHPIQTLSHPGRRGPRGQPQYCGKVCGYAMPGTVCSSYHMACCCCCVCDRCGCGAHIVCNVCELRLLRHLTHCYHCALNFITYCTAAHGGGGCVVVGQSVLLTVYIIRVTSYFPLYLGPRIVEPGLDPLQSYRHPSPTSFLHFLAKRRPR